MSAPDYDDPEVEEGWCEERRAEVGRYLQDQNVVHGRIGEWPAWHVAPYVSVWAIESAAKPGAMGWWVICGDLPTDYLGAKGLGDPREALRGFACRWKDAAVAMERGEAVSGFRIGRTAAERHELAALLQTRAALIAKWADDDSLWQDLSDA